MVFVSKAHHHLADLIFGRSGLYRGQPPVLFEVGAHEGISQSELAGRLEVSPPTMTNLLKRMEKSGLILRQRNSEDARYAKVFLTDKGQEMVVKAHQLEKQMDDITFAGLSNEEMATLTRLLDRVHANLTSSDSSRISN